MKLLIGILGLIVVLSLACFCCTGCTAPQVQGVINGTNQVIDQALSPVADHQGTSGLGPYIRLAATFARDVLYKGVDLIRILAPNAGEPAVTPSQ